MNTAPPMSTAHRAAPVGLVLRPRTDDDESFLYALYAETRDDVLGFGWGPAEVQGFLAMQYRARERAFTANHPSARSDIVVVDGQAIGRLLVDCRSTAIHLVDIALVAEHRGNGIGTALITTLIEEALLFDRPLHLTVRTDSRALGLYQRLGFVSLASPGEPDPTDLYLAMEYRAS
ncbi:MAG TPA: GNAT family N-acetyltransferase [Acidimicrobiales bacterium]|jgi:ribosomal protein S18 acetylase RimI-like enzyme|nr:GNAT family N-acetyltransferase [Acidimicrobiales bacterium]